MWNYIVLHTSWQVNILKICSFHTVANCQSLLLIWKKHRRYVKMFCLNIQAHCFTNLTYKHCRKLLCMYSILIYTLYTLLTSHLWANTRTLTLKMCTKPTLPLSLRWVMGVVRWIWGSCQIICKRSKMFVLQVKVLFNSFWRQL